MSKISHVLAWDIFISNTNILTMKDDNNQLAGTIYIDRQLDSYKNYLSDERINSIANQLDKETVLSKHFFTLFMELRGVAYNASFPYLMPNMLGTFYTGYIQSVNPRRTFLEFASAIVKRLSNEVHQLTKNQRLSRKIRERLIVISHDYFDIDKKLPIAIDSYGIWEDLLRMPKYTFMYAVWSNQRVSYLAGFSAYDNFIARVVKDALNLDRCRTTDRDFPDKIKNAFGNNAAALAWTGDEITTLREIRHSLAHAGGKITDPLRQRKYGCVFKDDIIQITPKDIKRLFLAITSAVEAIVSCSRDNECLNRK